MKLKTVFAPLALVSVLGACSPVTVGALVGAGAKAAGASDEEAIVAGLGAAIITGEVQGRQGECNYRSREVSQNGVVLSNGQVRDCSKREPGYKY